MGFLLVAVKDKDKNIRLLVGGYLNDWPVLLDPDEHLTRAYGIKSLPTVVVIDAGGRIVGVRGKPITASELEEMVKKATG